MNPTPGAPQRGRVVLLDYPYLERESAVGFYIDGEPYYFGIEVRSVGNLGDQYQHEAVDEFNLAHPGFATFLGDRSPNNGSTLDDVKNRFWGHEPMAREFSPPGLYMNDIIDRLDEWGRQESYHPNAEGHRQIASLLAADRDGMIGFQPENEHFTLTDPRVAPWSGTTAQTFTFRVNYRDPAPQDQSPTEAQVFVGTQAWDMVQESYDAVTKVRVFRSAELSFPAGTHQVPSSRSRMRPMAVSVRSTRNWWLARHRRRRVGATWVWQASPSPRAS